MAYQYGGLGRFMDEMEHTADLASSPRIGPLERNGWKLQRMREQLPYIAQMQQAQMQQRAQEEAEKRRYRYQYGI